MNDVLFFIYVIENIIILFYEYKKPEGIFAPVFILSMMSLGQLLPQLTTMNYLDNIYSYSVVQRMLIVMILCNFAFAYSWNKNYTKTNKGYDLAIWEIKGKWLKFLCYFCCICAVVFAQIVKGNIDSADGVIAFQFQGLGFIGIILSILYIVKYGNEKKICFFLIIATVAIVEYALTIYGSRQSIFSIVMLYAYLVYKKRPLWYGKIKKVLLVFFIVGCIGSLSIVEVRNSMSSSSGYFSNLSQINFMDNMKNSFTNSYNPLAGMDLGNGALCMERCSMLNDYNYGLFLWDGFVYNYVPQRIFGEEFKHSLMFDPDGAEYVKDITHNITCTTGYYDVFSSFGYFGFIIYYFLALIFCKIRKLADNSLLYEMMFLFALINSSVSVTHGLQLVVSKFEFVIMIFLFLSFTLYKKNILHEN